MDDASAFLKSILHEDAEDLTSWACLLLAVSSGGKDRVADIALHVLIAQALGPEAAPDEAEEAWDRLSPIPEAAGLIALTPGEVQVVRDKCKAVLGDSLAREKEGETAADVESVPMTPDQARSSQEAERRRSLTRARSVQQGMLPPAGDLPGIDVGSHYAPCDEIGGDFFDHFPVGPHELGVVIGDVSGHGIDAALVMAMARKTVQMHGQGRSSPRETLVAVNRELHGELPHSMFLTVGYGVLHLKLGTFRFVRAGHTPLLHVAGSDGRVAACEPGGMGVGIATGAAFEGSLQEETLELAAGDTLLWVTDGIEEAQNPRGEAFGSERLRALAETFASASPEAATRAVVDALAAFTAGAPARDDHTILAVRFKGPTGQPLRRPTSRLHVGRTNLARPKAAFIGRVRENRELMEMLSDRGGLFTLIGPGGIGKTTLSRHLGLNLVDRFPGGVWFADLSETGTSAEIAAAVADTLSTPLEEGPPEQAIADILEFRRPLLLIADNFEQVTDHAEATVGLWRDAAPEARILVTSRAALNLEGERIYRLDPLAAPPREYAGLGRDDVASFESVQLFVERARRSDSTFELTDENAASVAAICDGLDGMPLAIELAAARVAVLTTEDIASRLHEKFTLLVSNRRDRPARHRTLKATIDFSYELLSEEERSAFLQLSCFRGGADMASAEAVLAHRSSLGPEALDLLQSLRDKSFLQVRDGKFGRRFQLYPVMRDYALAMLDETFTDEERSALFERHAAYFAGFAEHWNEKLYGFDQVEAMERLEGELENVLEAGDRMTEAGDAELAFRNLLGAHALLQLRPRAGARSAERLWKLAPRLAPETHGDILTKVLIARSFSFHFCDDRESLRFAEQALAQAEQGADTATRGLAFLNLARAQVQLKQYEDAIKNLRRALVLARRSGHRHLEGMALLRRADALKYAGRPLEEALAVFNRAEDVALRTGNRFLLVRILNAKGITLMNFGDAEGSVPVFQRAVDMGRDIGVLSDNELTNVAYMRGMMGDVVGAMACYAEAEEVARRSGRKFGLMRCLWTRGLDNARRDSEAGLRDLEAAAGLARELGASSMLSEIYELMAKVEWMSGNTAQALALLVEAGASFRYSAEKSLYQHVRRGALRAFLWLELGKCREAADLTAALKARITDPPEELPVLGELLFAARALALHKLGEAPEETEACLAAVRAYEEARETRRPGSPWMPMQRLWLEDLAVAWALAAVESLDKPAGIG